MDLILFAVVGVICFSTGIKILCNEEQNKVFNKYHLEVVDVKKYNKACGYLVIGFGVVAELTLYLGSIIQGWYGIFFTLALIVEAVIVTKIYAKIEAKMKKNGNGKT